MRSQIEEALALVVHASAWADLEEEEGRSLSGVEITDVCDEISADAKEFATDVIDDILQLAGPGSTVEGVLRKAFEADLWHASSEEEWELAQEKGYARNRFGSRRGAWAEDFGACLGFMSLGHGVSWSDDHEDLPFQVPSREFHYYRGEDGKRYAFWERTKPRK